MPNIKYLVLLFSDTRGPPSENFDPKGFGGFSHNLKGYLEPLPKIAALLNRKAVFTPPFISLCRKHNFNRKLNKNNNWDTYLDVKNIKNLESDPPFLFAENGSLITNLSIKYYPQNVFLHKIDKDVDIAVLLNYNTTNKLKICSWLGVYPKNETDKTILSKFPNKKFPISKILQNYANKIIISLNLKDFVFLHIRRGDFLDRPSVGAPRGTRAITSPAFISSFINKKQNKTIFIATNERNLNYKKNILSLLKGKNIIFENDIIKYLPEQIKNDNYAIYCILHQIALSSQINIGTTPEGSCGYVKLGEKYDYKLSECNF
jgi:hypothetical protein